MADKVKKDLCGKKDSDPYVNCFAFKLCKGLQNGQNCVYHELIFVFLTWSRAEVRGA